MTVVCLSWRTCFGLELGPGTTPPRFRKPGPPTSEGPFFKRSKVLDLPGGWFSRFLFCFPPMSVLKKRLAFRVSSFWSLTDVCF